ncbi:hypothetical protein BGX20_002102 [Mortierella sp. AD010]|nr:hypothetical protein BGX20_002102 [Mortierella sp. AD010]
MQKYASHIRSIYFDFYAYELFERLPWEAMTQIQEIHMTEEIKGDDIQERIVHLIERNRGLCKVVFHSSKIATTRKIAKTLSSYSNLKVLKLYLGKVDSKMAAQLLDIATRLQELMICTKEIVIPNSMDNWTQFPSMTALSLSDKSGLSLYQQLEIIKRCPHLRRLCWVTVDTPLPIPELCQVISTNCRELSELDFLPITGKITGLTVTSISDADIAQLINSCNDLMVLKFYPSGSGSLAIQAIRPHFSKLTRLEVSGGHLFDSDIVQEIMTSCPMLIELKADKLYARSILGAVKRDAPEPGSDGYDLHPQDWVCLNLRRLDVFIFGVHNSDMWQRQILHQLSRLKKLEELSIGGWDDERSWSRDGLDLRLERGLDLRLERGLDILASLKQLRTFEFRELYQQQGEQEIRWVLREWPKLRSFYGRSNANRAVNQQLASILSAHRVNSGY